MFTHVRTLAINDYIPWDYYFFNKISQCFPFIEVLLISNSLARKNLKNDIEEYPIVTFNRLFFLHISFTHVDYIQQLLTNQYTHLPRLCQLHIEYEHLITLTNNFTINPTQLNCLQIKSLITNECFVRSQNFSQFFPLL